jgi:hypothetical protein
VNEYLVLIRVASHAKPWVTRVNALNKEHATFVAGVVLGATGNFGGTSVVTAIEVKLMRRG